MTARLWRWLRSFPLWLGPWWFALIALCLGSMWGRWLGRVSVKPVVVTETRTVEVVRWKERTETVSNVAAQEQTRTVVQTRWLPGKEVVRTEFVERATDTKRTDLAVRDVAEDRTLNVTRVERITTEVRPRWGVTGGYGLTTGKDRAWLVGGSVRVWKGELGVTATRAGGVTAGYVTAGIRF